MHPALRRALDEHIAPVFQEMAEEQGWLSSPERWCKVLDLISDADVRETLDTRVSFDVSKEQGGSRTTKYSDLLQWRFQNFMPTKKD